MQLSATSPVVYPFGFVGPLQAGAVRAEFGQTSRPGSPGSGLNSAMLITGMTFSTANPVVGSSFQATLSGGGGDNYYLGGTTWTDTITYQGVTTPPSTLSFYGTSATINAKFPGTYTVGVRRTSQASSGLL